MPQKGPTVRQKTEKGEGEGAEKGEVDPAARPEGEAVVQSHLPVPPQYGEEEKGEGGGGPEQEVGGGGEHPPPPLPGHPQPVVQRAQGRAQQQGFQQIGPLPGHALPAQCSSQDSRERPRSALPSS